MSPGLKEPRCAEAAQMALYALDALGAEEASIMEAHLSHCAECRGELAALRRLVAGFADWPTDVLRPSHSAWESLAKRLAQESGRPALPAPERWDEPQWQEVAPGIRCKLLATDEERHRVSMLVRMAPGVDYPPHRHAGVEEMHLLEGELRIGERKLTPGDYARGEPDTEDPRAWTETGCTCVLITSTRDTLI